MAPQATRTTTVRDFDSLPETRFPMPDMISMLVITPWVLIRERRWLKSEWQSRKGSIVVVGFLSGFTYLMILFALTMSKVSYVAAVREVSIVLSAFFGIVCLGEKNGRQKMVGAVFITAGVIAIGLSR